MDGSDVVRDYKWPAKGRIARASSESGSIGSYAQFSGRGQQLFRNNNTESVWINSDLAKIEEFVQIRAEKKPVLNVVRVLVPICQDMRRSSASTQS